MSMVKPPDPEILKTLPLKDQRQLMAQHAEMCLSQSSSRSHSRSGSVASLSQAPSRRGSLSVESEEKDGKDKDQSGGSKPVPGPASKGALKPDTALAATSDADIHSILKPSTEAPDEPRGILKKSKSQEINTMAEAGEDTGSPEKGILKQALGDDFVEDDNSCSRPRSNSQPSGILKRERGDGMGSPSTKPRGILKAPSQEKVDEQNVVAKSAIRSGNVSSDEGFASPDMRSSHPKPVSSSTLHGQEVVPSLSSTVLISSGLDLQPEEVQKITCVENNDVASEGVASEDNVSDEAASSGLDVSNSRVSDVDRNYNQSEAMTAMAATDKVDSLEDTPKSSKLERSRFDNRKVNNERYKTQPADLSDDMQACQTAEAGPKKKYKYEGRHRTQPITDDEMRDAEANTPVNKIAPGTPGGSICDRLNQLKTSGEEGWRRRVGPKDSLVSPADLVKKREKTSPVAAARPTSIAHRLNELEVSKMTWRERVEDSDAMQFTVAGKVTHTAESHLVSKLMNQPKRDEEQAAKSKTPAISPSNPTKEFISKIPLPKEIVQDDSFKVETAASQNPPQATAWGRKGSEEELSEAVKVMVPAIGEDMERFFNIKSIHEITDRVEMDIDDFDNIFVEAEMILPTTRKPRPARKTKSSHLNPLKTLSQTIEVKQEYMQVSLGTAGKEFKRMKKEHLAKDAGFAQAALAGLASKENFKQVELRRSDSNSLAHGQRLEPFNEVMLFHVKGRRMVQTRLVAPHTDSLNSGDCFILVTPEKVIQWEGQYANVIEKARASDIANFIQQKKDLGCKRASEVDVVYQAQDHLGPGRFFWSVLEGPKQCQECGPDQEDELYEVSVVCSNMVYKLEGNALRPWEEYWGAMPKYEMLKKNEVVVFDFGTEFYVWQGKTVPMEQRKLGMRLAKQLYGKGYDYTESAINPFSPLRLDEGSAPAAASSRPKWTIFGKVNQNMETILFQEKFADWPDSSRMIQCRGHDTENINKELLELRPFDAKKMIPLNSSLVTLKLEGADVGRGVRWSEDMQGFIKEQDIITLDVTAWHVMEYERYELNTQHHGQFHDGDTYVVRWQYMISNANLRSLKGSALRSSLTGRERCAYFFWQGKNSTINEKGASALMTVELDEERGPQVRVIEGKEPPCFLNLFKGKMILHLGKREEPLTNTQGDWRLYCLRGDFNNEMSLMEMPVDVSNLRSRSSVVVLNVRTGLTYIWHGVKSPKHTRILCRKTVDLIKESAPLELGLYEEVVLTITEVEEGEEKLEIWEALGPRNRPSYHSLLNDPKPYVHTMRLFHMSSVNMVFDVHEQLNPGRTPDLTVPFPFLQSDLYSAIQPALFLLDCHDCVYLWQGWWPAPSKDQENVHTGSAASRFNLERRLAMETTLHYCKEKNPSNPPEAYVVCGGLEPHCVTSLFPHWEVNLAVKELALGDQKPAEYIENVHHVLHRMTHTRYTLAQLQERPLPDGVDALKLEAFLHDDEFEKYLGQSREDFYNQPAWKQLQVKQAICLF